MQTARLITLVALIAPAASAQWTYVASGTNAELRGLAASANAVWASGARGTIVRSLDGGRTWVADTVPGQTHLDFRSIAAHDARTALIASAGEAQQGLAKIFATADSGRSWRLSYSTADSGVFFDAIGFFGQNHAIAVSDPVDGAFFILLSNDGARTWMRPATIPPTLPGEAAFAASGSSLAIVGDGLVWLGTGGGGRARVFVSNSGGYEWRVVDTPVHAEGPASGIFSIATFDGRRLVAVGGDYTKPKLAATSVALSHDYGRTWRAARNPPAAYLSGVAYAGDSLRLVAVGLAGTFVSRDGGDSWVQTDTIAMNSVRFSGTRGFAVGPGGRVAYTDGIQP